MDDNLKDILLVLIGSVASLLGSVITLTLQSRHERRLAKQTQRQRHFEEVREHLFTIISMSDFFKKFLVTNDWTEKSIKDFETNINIFHERLIKSRFYAVPERLSISKDKKILSKLAKVEQHLNHMNILISTVKKGELTKVQLDEIMVNHQQMYEIMEYVLDALEKSIYK